LSVAPDSESGASVVYQSRGSLLLYGDAEQVAAALPLLPAGLRTLAVSTRPLSTTDTGKGMELITGTLLQVRGHLGAFRATTVGADGPLDPLDMAPLSPNGDGLFDLVLDLYPKPLIDIEVPPLGYARSRGAGSGQQQRIDRLASLTGAVHKPRYFDFDQTLCAHDRQQVPGCDRCIGACPAAAIESQAGRIHVDPYLCRGCGSCTLACPSGALSYTLPRPATTLQQISRAISERADEGTDSGTGASNNPPMLVIHSGKRKPAGLPLQVATLAVNTITSVGIESWLGALALGASRVLVLRSSPSPPTSDQQLDQQLQIARRLLLALGEAPERLRVIDSIDGVDWGGLPNPWPPASLSVLRQAGQAGLAGKKRPLMLAALSHLASHLDPHRMAPRELPASAGIGGLTIDAPRCSLCHACVRLCPSGALRDPDGALTLIESACVQCGLCVAACPEQALRLAPRFQPRFEAAPATEQTLKPASEAFHCVRCGDPFATRRLVESSMAHVSGHPMFQGEEGRRLLQMCPECRQKEGARLPA